MGKMNKIRMLIDNEERWAKIVFDTHEGYIKLTIKPSQNDSYGEEIWFDWADIEELGVNAKKRWKEHEAKDDE